MRRTISFLLPVAAACALAGTAGAHQQVRTGTAAMTPGNIVQVAASNPQFSTLVALVKQAGLVGALSSPKAHLTVFAPTNAAFAALKKNDPMTFKAVASTPALLKKILTYHVLGTTVDAAAATAAAKKGAAVKTLEGETIKLSLAGGKIKLNGSATVVTANVMASNGVIHVINAVLTPPSVTVSG